jgi:Lecithin:cholesterol acyltransferase
MARHDLVVVVPGIMGSTLVRHGRPVWSPSAPSIIRAIASFGRHVKALQLPDDIGDYHPGDGVEAEALMPDLHALPGIWTPVRGYDRLVDRLQLIGFRRASADPTAPPGNLLLFPYDWRLSNRYNGIELGRQVERSLGRWREQGAQYADAKVCFVCHSMGGLVARWYIAHGGAEITRKLITLGTPYRGAARSVDQLVHGVHKGIGPLSIDLTGFARSLPSLYQLLPSYACLAGPTGLAPISEATGLPELDGTRLDDAMLFYKQLEDSERSDAASTSRRHAITGSRQCTATTVEFSNGELRLLDTYEGDDLAGDGTVPAVAGPAGVPLDDNSIHHIADKHGNLQSNPAVLDEIEAILLAKPIVPKAALSADLRVDVPELLMEQEQLLVTVRVPSGAPAVKVVLTDEAGVERAVQIPRRSSDDLLTTNFGTLRPGGYTVTAMGRAPGMVNPVTSELIVWPRTTEL